MALGYARTALNTATSMVAGAANVTGATVDNTLSYRTTLNIKLTNGATGPTVAAQVQIQRASDAAGTLFADYGGPLVGAVANSAVTSWVIELPGGGAFRLVSGSNTGQNVTLDSDYERQTGI